MPKVSKTSKQNHNWPQLSPVPGPRAASTQRRACILNRPCSCALRTGETPRTLSNAPRPPKSSVPGRWLQRAIQFCLQSTVHRPSDPGRSVCEPQASNCRAGILLPLHPWQSPRRGAQKERNCVVPSSEVGTLQCQKGLFHYFLDLGHNPHKNPMKQVFLCLFMERNLRPRKGK